MNNPNQMNPSSRFRPCSPASFPHHHIHHLCPHHHHHHHHGCHHHQHSHSHLHHHHFNCHAHVLQSNLSPPPSPLQNPEPETYPSQKDSNFGATTSIHTEQTSSSAIQVFHQPEEEEEEEEGLLEQGEEDDEDDDPVFVLTDEWREFFARSEAKRQLEKKQRAKERKQRNVR